MLSKSKAYISDVTGIEVSDEERALFSEHPPLGFIVFARNCESPEQLTKLCAQMRKLVGWHAPILIDQEGGRVARLRPPHWRAAAPAGDFSALAARDASAAKQAVYLNARLMAQELRSMGVNVDCAPMLDILFPHSDNIIGDRAFGTDPMLVTTLGSEMARGLSEGGVLPIMKHIPGHGRATVDSHEDLPVVGATLEELQRTDFVPFRTLRHIPWAMTAHIIYSAIDDKNPATLSKPVVDIIRKDIGYEGIIITDDLSMKALKGPYEERVAKAVGAGCDIMLHCNGTLEERRQIAEATPKLNEELALRIEKSLQAVADPAKDNELHATAETELKALLAG